MKIAITSSSPEKARTIRDDIMKAWNGVFPSPSISVFDDPKTMTAKGPVDFDETQWSSEEVDLWKKIWLLQSQYDEYKEQKNIVFLGSPIDILAETLYKFSVGEVGDDFVDKVIYWHKQLLKRLDLVYIAPAADYNKGEDEELTEEEEHTLMMDGYIANIFTQYTDNFEQSELFIHDDCPGIALLETDDPISEIRLVVDRNGNIGEEDSPEQIQKLYDSIKDQRLLKNVKEIMEQKRIPLVGGGTTTFSL